MADDTASSASEFSTIFDNVIFLSLLLLFIQVTLMHAIDIEKAFVVLPLAEVIKVPVSFGKVIVLSVFVGSLLLM